MVIRLICARMNRVLPPGNVTEKEKSMKRDCENCEYYKDLPDEKNNLKLKSCSKWECVKEKGENHGKD